LGFASTVIGTSFFILKNSGKNPPLSGGCSYKNILQQAITPFFLRPSLSTPYRLSIV